MLDLKGIEERIKRFPDEPYRTDAEQDVLDLLAEVKRLDEELAKCTSGNGTYIGIESHNRLWTKERIRADKAEKKSRDARNELCLKCGRYREAHNGTCEGCRWNQAEAKEAEK